MDKYSVLEQEFRRKNPLPEFAPGDVIDVSVNIKEGEKERVQVFSGTVIARRGTGLGASFTVRRIVQGEGVERTFPVHSPKIANVEAKTRSNVRRAKLYYLRDLQGKATRLKERMDNREAKS